MRILAIWILFVTKSVAYAAGPCGPTPQAALEAQEQTGTTGFRVVAIRTDPTLNRTFATIVRCDHPEWPATTLVTHQIPTIQQTPTVRSGETIRLFRNETNTHLELTAVSDQSGSVGDRIRLHVTNLNGAPPRYYYGHVRGPANVEME